MTITHRPASPADKRPERTEPWDHSSHDEFYDYYATESLRPETLDRFRRPRDVVLSIPGLADKGRPLDVADIGCGAGTMATVWGELGHSVWGLDINEPLIELARTRAAEAGLAIEFAVGSATDIPRENASFDVCLAPELLEHVADWQTCLDEFARILRPGGALFLSTTNKLCPRQMEFNLPFYSWYPGRLKRRYEHLAVTSRPEIANYAKYPAVNWFTFYGLREALHTRGFDRFFDRFDLATLRHTSGVRRATASLLRTVPPLRFAGHIVTSGTTIVAVRRK